MGTVDGLAEFGGTRVAGVWPADGGMVKLTLEGYESGGEGLFTPARARALAAELERVAGLAEQEPSRGGFEIGNGDAYGESYAR